MNYKLQVCLRKVAGAGRRAGLAGMETLFGQLCEVFTELIYKIQRMHSYLDLGLKSNGTETTQADIINNVGAG